MSAESPSPAADQARRWPLLGRSIFAKQLSFYLLFIVLIFGIISFLFFSVARTNLESEVGRKLQYVARISARNTPFARLELIRPGDEQSRMVLRLKEKLGEIQEATGVENIYVFRADGNALLDLVGDTRIGAPFVLANFTDELLQELRSDRSVNTRGYIGADEAIHISAYAPVHDPEGQLFAIVGIDAGAAELVLIEAMRLRLYWIAGIGMAVATLLALFFARSITSPVRQIAQTAEALGRGDYSARAAVNSGDEVGVLAESINRMAERVRQRDAALVEMAAGVAHEIRNPLNSIKLLISLLEEELREQGASVQPSTLKTLDYEIGKLNRFIEEFLTYARPTTSLRDNVSLREIVSSVLEMAALAAAERNVSIEERYQGESLYLNADRLRLEQTLLNIALNAIQACADGGKVTILADGSCADGGVDFVVEDSGPGLDPVALPQLFEPFFTTKSDGTGLGLANARKIVEEHGGQLRAENRAEGGARFVLHLPAERIVKRENRAGRVK